MFEWETERGENSDEVKKLKAELEKSRNDPQTFANLKKKYPDLLGGDCINCSINTIDTLFKL